MSLLQHLMFIEPDRPLQTALESHYVLPLVGLSVLVAIVAAYTGFLLSERIRASETRQAKLAWLIAGATALGAGIWAMHFIGMLAFILPVAVKYDVTITAFSLVPAFIAGLVVLTGGSTGKYCKLKQLGRGVVMGAGIGLMHYTGMAAMEMDAVMRYDPLVFSLSIVVAVGLSLLALQLKQRAELGQLRSFSHQQGILAASIVMGLAINGMHYTGMAAAHYFPAQVEMTKSADWEPHFLALVIGLVVSGILILLISAVFISRRLALMNQLKTSEARLKMVFDTVVDGLIISDEKGLIQSFNQAAEKIFGYRRDEVIGLNVSILMPEQERGQHDNHMRRHRKTGEAKIIGIGREVLGQRKDGSLFPIDLAVNKTRTGSKAQFVGIIRDISQRRQAEQDEITLGELRHLALQSSSVKEFLDTCLNTLLTSVSWLRTQSSGVLFLTSNQGKGQALHQTVEFNLTPELHSLCARVPFGKCLCGRAAAERTVQFAHCVDERHETCYEGMPPHGHYCLPLLQDDSVLGVLMLELSHGHEQSSAEIGFLERVTEIISMGVNRRYTTRDLRKAKDAAESAAKAKSNFLATMSHEIRTPMNGVLGMLHLLGKTGLAARQQRYLDTATGSGELLLTVINDILDYSKLGAGKLELESIPFDPLSLAEETVSLMAKGAHEKRLELICSVKPDTPRMVRGDPTRLRQVLTNLVSNAIKFTEQGNIVLHVAPTEENLILFSVRDTGIGIPEKEKQHLFKAFTQADSSHTRKYGGTGLGLAICQQLVLAMGGNIRVTSTPGQGSDFSFEVPLEPLEHTRLQRPQASNLLAQQRILVVDDNCINREVLTSVLTAWQVSCVEEAEEGADALQQLRAAAEADRPFDIALLDMQMPGMSGLELAQAIRTDRLLDGLHLLMLSSVDCSETSPELDAWLTKPVRQSDLYSTLLLILGETTAAEERNTTSVDHDETCWFGGSRLLLVEDNYVNQEVAKEILASAGFVVDLRENGLDAVQAVQEHDYDIVLMDVQMPVMDGLEATRQIRALGGRFTKLPIIAMTAHALSGDSDKSIAAGMNAHLTKPIDPGNIFKTIANWITPTQKDISDSTGTGNEQNVDTETDSLPDLPGIDVADGLARLRGNKAAYRRILIGFRDKQTDAASRLEAFIGQHEWEEAASLAHTLKGSGGNLGAKCLYSDAAAMEQACRAADAEAVQSKLTALCASLAEVIEGLAGIDQQAVTTPGQADVVQPVDLEAIDTLLEDILQFLDTDLGEALASLARLQQQTAGSDYAARLTELESALNDFDIDAAREITESLRSGALC